MGTDPTRTSGGSTDGATVRATVRATALSDLTGSMGAVEAVDAEELEGRRDQH
jgi:hypothetical protein